MLTNHIYSKAILLLLIASLLVPGAVTDALAIVGPTLNTHTTAFIASIVVTNFEDSGPGSLRNAVEQANSDGVQSMITFSPSLSGGSIRLQSLLPGLYEDGTTIDGDINGDHRPDIELNGEALTDANGVQIWSSNNVVRGLAINRFGWHGVTVRGHNNRVEYCYLGTDLTGTQPLGNGGSGVSVEGGASGNQIGPQNLVAHNGSKWGWGGISVVDDTLPAYPEFAGLTPDYSSIFPVLDFPNTRGAFTSADGITPVDGNGHPFADNFGARFTGMLTLGATGEYTFAVLHPDDNVRVVVDRATILEVRCCESFEQVATLTAGAHSIEVDYGAGPIVNGFALEITGTGSVSLTTDGQSGLWGEFFQLRIPTERNRITQNSIFDNHALGIDLDALEDDWGVNPNDPGDGDIGPNTALNFPVLTSALATPGRLVVKGSIDTPNPRLLTLEFFSNAVPTPGGDPSGHGEGAIYLGSGRPNPQGKFTATLPPVPAGTLISATVTDAENNTSEFAENIEAKSQPQ